MRILLLLFFLLLSSSLTFSQGAGDKLWNNFWHKFSLAIKTKDINQIKKLSVKNEIFFSGDPEESRDDFLKNLGQGGWKDLLESIKSGFKKVNKEQYSTKDDYMIFDYVGGKWLFSGISAG